ncbi:unnamed protein product [Pseudo-nitzschia multistriata]|uniref:Fe2OG dioxygenase domain-containing protein n=1 Tax=Pseudo-nitzschia multistriata TaxID=183589 RepID=A0A448Z0K6_9STRA|nr:unnamed protein product [Pseudo-nitzschia multistriata]
MVAFCFRAFLITTGAISLASAVKRPDWLSHVDKVKLQEYMGVATERHNEAIRTALQTYEVDQPTTLTEEEQAKETELRENLKLNEYRIKAPGRLPDFHDELGESPVFVTNSETPLFSKEECNDVVGMADAYFDSKDEMAKMPSGQYYIQGFWIKDVPDVKKWFVEKCRSRMFPLLKKQFPDFVDDIEDLVVDSAYLFKYKPEPGLRTEIHTDGGCLSFTFALNPKSEYEGGGTWVEGLTSDEDPDMGETIEMDMGHCTIRPGGVRHCGNPLKSGTRYIIGGFCMNKKRVEHVRQLVNNCPQRTSAKTTREALECAIALNPEFEGPYTPLAQIYENDGTPEKAKQVMEDCLRLANPKSTASSYYLGTFKYKEGDYKEAMRYMKNCLEIDPNDGDALGTLSHCYAQLKDVEKEKETLQKIIEAPGVANPVLSQAYCNLGIMHAGEGEELLYYAKSLEAEPSSLPAMHNLGNALARREQWDRAVGVFRRVVKDLAKTNEEKYTYLKMLYQVSTAKLRADATAKDQADLMSQLAATMGQENLDQLVAFQKTMR